MDSEALRTFVAIHHARGFSSAAQRLHRSQPAISRRIALFEEEIGAPLFERAAGGVVLSQAGRALLPHAERVLAALKDASDAVAALQEHGGSLAIAAVGTLASTRLAATLKRFAVQYPKVDLSLRTATSSEVSDLVRRGEVTIGLRYFEDRSPEMSNRALAPEKLVVACAADHRLAGKRVPGLRHLQHETWLAFPEPAGRREAAAEAILAQFIVRGVTAVEWTPVDSLTAQKCLIEAGFGLALLPVSSIAEERRAGTLATIAVGDLKVTNPVAMVTRKDAYLSPASLKLLQFLQDSAPP